MSVVVPKASRGIPVVLALLSLSLAQSAQDIPIARSHNNESPAGRLEGQMLRVSMVVREARLFPEAADGPSVVVPAFGIDGGAPEIPGPFLRVRTGMRIAVALRNELAATIEVHGFRARHSPDTAIAVPPGETREVAFEANEPGLFLYWASVGPNSLEKRDGRDELLNGAIRVDGPADSVREEAIFLLQHMSAEGPPTVADKLSTELWLVNGKMWPFGKSFEHPLGTPIVWRWLNASNETHPMHLHGSYFDLLATGDGEHETRFQGNRIERIVTHAVPSGHTFLMRWQPERDGNWLFHCHILFHTSSELGVWKDDATVSIGHDEHTHMSGLVVGTHVTAAKGVTAARPIAPRLQDLDVIETGERYADVKGYGALPKLAYSSPLLVLKRGQPVAVTIRNRMHEPTSVHWHGIELESYFDGVPGYGGNGSEVTPEIGPGESFIARFTPPRAGTFIYHTHMQDYEQLSSGLYGALIVLPDGETLDAEADRVFLISRDGVDDRKAPMLINGSRAPQPIRLHVGRRYRFRLINITPAHDRMFSLMQGDAMQQWRPLAKDGMDLPAIRAKSGEAATTLNPGETYDVEWRPQQIGTVTLVVRHPRNPEDELRVEQRIVIER